MDKDSAKNTKTHDSPALRRCQERNSTPARKRRASPEQKTLRKGTNLSETLPPNTSEEYVGVRGGKRKLREDGEVSSKMRMEKRRRFGLFDNEKACCSSDIGKESFNTSVVEVKKTGGKRKAVCDVEEPSSKKRRTLDLNETKKETKKEKKTNVTKKANKDETKKKDNKDTNQTLSVEAQRAIFMAKYQQQKQLGEGGCGSVFAGYRRADNLPVAIKHIPRNKVYCKHMDEDGKRVSVEVAIMLKLAATSSGSVETPAAISLLDWYDLGQELILVLERPVPCKDLLNYIEDKGGSLKEGEAKIILKQLVEAAVELQDKRIFHRDIKVDNLLIETGSGIPRVRLIDFGLGCFVKKGSSYRVFYGTPAHSPPEWHSTNTYRAGPTTVWQLGVVLYETLHSEPAFETTKFLDNRLRISKRLSKDCQDFLRMCLTIDPQQRVTLEQLQRHPWLR